MPIWQNVSAAKSGPVLIAAIASEFFGTSVLVFSGTAVAVAEALHARIFGAELSGPFPVAVAFGSALAVLVAVLSKVSGAHFNPAVTISLASGKKFAWQNVVPYLVAQLAGAITGSAIVRLLFGSNAALTPAYLGAPVASPGTSTVQIFGWEGYIALILVLTILYVTSSPRLHPFAVPFVIGAGLFVAVLIGSPISGGASNPARALAPMLLSGRHAGLLLYVIGPIVGGIIATLIFSLFFVED